MKIILAGGSGQIGNILARHWTRAGHEIVVLGRNPHPDASPRMVGWNPPAPGDWTREIDGADVVVNLAGRTVNCRYHARNRDQITESRLTTTRALGAAIASASRPPRVWLQSSTATIYAHRFDAPNDEASGLIGGSEKNVPDSWRFSIDVARRWEEAALSFDLPDTRLVLMRSSMVMSPDRGGIFDVMHGLVRRGLGGTAGNGRQFVSWIHDHDFARALDFILEHPELEGAVNVCSPNPLPYTQFMRTFRDALGTRIGLPATRWMLEIGALFMRTETELVLKSRRVVPGKLRAAGFRFAFPEWTEAAKDLGRRHG